MKLKHWLDGLLTNWHPAPNQRRIRRSFFSPEALESRILLTAYTVDTTSDVSDGDFSSGNFSLREAIEQANANPGTDSINFDATLFGTQQTITLSSGVLNITDSVSIAGPGMDLLTIDSNGSGVFQIDDGNAAVNSEVTISGVTLTSSGILMTDAVHSRESLTIRDLKATGFSVEREVAGTDDLIHIELSSGAWFNLINSELVDNYNSSDLPSDSTTTALLIAAETGSTVSIQNSRISGNGGEFTSNQNGQEEFRVNFVDGVVFQGDGHLNVSGSEINDNKGGGLQKVGAGRLEISDSVISGNFGSGNDDGGLFMSGGTGSITASTIQDNQAYFGGGVTVNNATLTIADSTISGNQSTDGGGGIRLNSGSLTIERSTITDNYGSPGGGGIRQNAGSLTITSSTISGNLAYQGGGIYQAGGTLSISHSTIARNNADYYDGGGLLANGVSATLDHVIVADNNATGSGNDVFGTVTSSFSLIESAAGASIVDNGGTITGIDPLLAPLADNGGPTLTHRLLPGSAALNSGDASLISGVGATPETDQRGIHRVQQGQIDIGAVEIGYVVDTIADENDGDYSQGDLSLREAIELANAAPGIETITFDTTLFASPQQIDLTLGELSITDSLTILGPGQENLTINGNGNRVFNIDDGSSSLLSVELIGMNLLASDFVGNGGAILTQESLTLRDSAIIGDQTQEEISRGGGIYSVLPAGAELNVIDSALTGLRVDSDPGDGSLRGGDAIFVIAGAGSNVNITGSTFRQNSALDGSGTPSVIEVVGDGDAFVSETEFFEQPEPGDSTLRNRCIVNF